jgi:hypothetical protein
MNEAVDSIALKTDLIKSYATAQINALLEKSKSIKTLDNNLVKGMLRELSITNALSPFLSSQFRLGTGIIINQVCDQSAQTDLIILNNHVLPPFIGEQNLGVFPIECVVGTIEVKSDSRKSDLDEAEKDVKNIKENICRDKGTLTPTKLQKPFCSLFGFYGSFGEELLEENTGKRWLDANITGLNAICLAEKYCWINTSQSNSPHWTMQKANSTYEEIKRFLAIIVDYTRFKAHLFESEIASGPQDWVSAYIRFQRSC